MDIIAFSLGEIDVSFGLALLAAGIGIMLMLGALLLVVLRNQNQRVEEAAKVASDALRVNFTQQVAERDGRIRDLDAELRQNRQDNSALHAQVATLRAKMEEQQIQAEQNLRRFQNARQQMTDEFKVIATDILSSHGETFSRQNREQVDNLLKPLAEKISEFQKQSHEGGARLAQQIRMLAQDSLRMSEEANNLTRALKGNAQAQGAWGEMILTSILEKSGLREGQQFLTQQTHAGVDGARVRTDVEVLFPNNDRLVVDSKVSLTAFEAFTNCEDEDERALNLRNHIQSLRAHIKSLGSKDYQMHAESGLNYVMMFIPIEAAFSVAIEKQSDLIDYAIARNVYITTPTTLMVALRTVANVWDTENRNKNAEEIANRAGALYDKVTGFLGSMDRLEKSITSAQKNFDEARGQLVSGRGSVVRQVEMLQELGAKNNKQIPGGWDVEADKTAPETAPETEGLLPSMPENNQNPAD